MRKLDLIGRHPSDQVAEVLVWGPLTNRPSMIFDHQTVADDSVQLRQPIISVKGLLLFFLLPLCLAHCPVTALWSLTKTFNVPSSYTS